MITSLGYGTYMFFGSLMVVMGVWAYFFIPETKGLSLEEMDKLFGGVGTSQEDVEAKVKAEQIENAEGEDSYDRKEMRHVEGRV